jgi:hypothetical protein
MNKKQIAYILKYSHPKQLYVVTYKNILLRLDCPFKAIVKEDIGRLKRNQIVEVVEVKITSDVVTVFIINGSAFFYYHFDILVD